MDAHAPTLGARARAVLSGLERRCTHDQLHADVEALLADLVGVGVAELPIVRGDHVMTLDDGAV